MYRRILVPLDGSELAEHVLPHVTQLAGATGALIILLRVPSEPLYDYLVPEPEIAIEMCRDIELGAQVYLDEIADELRAMDLQVTTRVAWGAPIATTILNIARELRVDLIAMSTHGRSGIARLVVGSVTDQVAHHASVPVLLVQPDVPRVAHHPGARSKTQPLTRQHA